MARTRPEEHLGFRWLETPGVFCDTYTARYFPDATSVRITFGEYTDRDHYPYYRYAVVMPLSDIKRLVRTLNRLIREAEQPEEGEEETPEPPAPESPE